MPVLGHPGFHSFYIADDRRKEKNPGCLSRHTILHGDQLDDFDIWMKENIANFHTIIRDCVLRKIILFSLNLLHQLPYLRRHRDLLYYNSSSPQNDTQGLCLIGIYMLDSSNKSPSSASSLTSAATSFSRPSCSFKNLSKVDSLHSIFTSPSPLTAAAST